MVGKNVMKKTSVGLNLRSEAVLLDYVKVRVGWVRSQYHTFSCTKVRKITLTPYIKF